MKHLLVTVFFALILSILIPHEAHAQIPRRKTAILGPARVTAEQMERFVHSINPDAPYLAAIFLEEGAKENIRGDIAFVQALRETGYFRFGGMVLPEQNNFAGIGATNTTAKGKGAWFETPRDGIRAQIQHLKAYATHAPLRQPLIDPRFHLVQRGSARFWEDLNGKWAVPGTSYGQDILRLYTRMRSHIGSH